MLEEATLQVQYDQGSHAPLRHRRYLSNPLREALNHVDWNASFISSIPFNEMGFKVSGNKYSAVFMYNKKVHTWDPLADPEGGDRVPDPPPLKNHKNIGFLCKTGPDPLKNHKATKPAFNRPPSARQRNAILMAFGWAGR